MVCKNCGNEMADNSSFCSKCGKKVEQGENTQINEDVKVINEVNCVNKNTRIPSDAVPQMAVKTEKTKKKENRFVTGLLSFLCCVIIFVFMFAAITTLTVRNSLKSENVENIVEDFDVTLLTDDKEVKKLIGKTATTGEIEKIYRKTSFKDYVEETVIDYTDYILGGKTPKGIDADDVKELVAENSYEIHRICGYEVKPKDFEKIEEFFDDNGEENIGVLSSQVRTNWITDVARVMFSVFAVILFSVLALLFFVLMFKIRKWRANTLSWGGVTCIVTAAVFMVLLTVRPIISLMLPDNTIVASIVGAYLDSIILPVLTLGSIVVLAGIMMIVISVVIKKIKQKRA